MKRMKQRSCTRRRVCVISAKLEINHQLLQCCKQHNVSLAAAPCLLSQVLRLFPSLEEDSCCGGEKIGCFQFHSLKHHSKDEHSSHLFQSILLCKLTIATPTMFDVTSAP